MYRIKSRPDMPKNGPRNSKKKKVEAPEDYPKAPGAEKRDNPSGLTGGKV
jgi:hypothetical protein